MALVDKEGLSSRGFWRRVLDTSGDGMVPLRELFESGMATFKEKEWESVSFEDFLQEALDKLGCDDSKTRAGAFLGRRSWHLRMGAMLRFFWIFDKRQPLRPARAGASFGLESPLRR